MSARPALTATLLAVVAAFLWAAYYPLVLAGASGTDASAVLAVPFLIGGAAFALSAVVATASRAAFVRTTRELGSYGRGGLLAMMQAAVLSATYRTGAVDTSLLSLAGDVVVLPLLLMGIFGERTGSIRRPAFVAGIAACTAGATLTIASGGGARAVGGFAVPLALGVPVLIAAYFLAMARANRTAPTTAVAAHATLIAGAFALLAAPLLPGGLGAIAGLSMPAFLALSAIGLTSFYLGPWLYFQAVRIAGLLLPSVLMSTIPLFTLLLAATVLGARPGFVALAGIPIAVGGAVLALRGDSEPEISRTR